MIGKKLQENENTVPNSHEMKKLKETFPQYFSNKGEFELDKFQDFLKQEEVDISKEGYELEFLGKSYAKYLSSLETETYISPDVNHNSKDENKNSENLYIVGDNIDALKHLLSSYAGKIKCIYIDPPYNTGTDGFVYPDNFQFNVGELSQKIGITEDEAQRILDLAGKSTHSAWLTFMYPRLVLARDLLTEDGVIFISIDDNEQANLKLICDEIYGEENFLAQVVWERAFAPINLKKNFSESHDYVLVYAKDSTDMETNGIPRSKEQDSLYKNPDKDPRGPWQSDNFSVGPAVESNIYEIITPSGKKVMPPSGYSWRFSKKKYKELLDDNRVWFGEEGENGPRYKRFLSEVKQGVTPMTIWKYEDVGHSQSASQGLKKLFGNKAYFTYPKPVGLMKRMLQLYSDSDSVILDFFSGSATTAHATMELNADDEGNRKYIMVQIPEKIAEKEVAYKDGYRTIDEIGRTRIEKAAKKIKEETNADINYGYKLYFLETPEEKTLVELENFEPEIKLITEDMISVFDNEHSSGKESILATWINEDGYGLTASSKPYTLNSYKAHLMEKSLYIIDEGLEDEDVMTLIKRIENEELDITRVIVYVHSIRFNVLQELRKNLNVLKNNKKATLIERF